MWSDNSERYTEGKSSLPVGTEAGHTKQNASLTGSSTETGNVLRKSLYSPQVTYKNKSEISFVRTDKNKHDIQSLGQKNGASGLSHNFQLGDVKRVLCGR